MRYAFIQPETKSEQLTLLSQLLPTLAEAVEKAMPCEPIDGPLIVPGDSKIQDHYICSKCYENSNGMRDTVLDRSDVYCRKCGQKIDWKRVVLKESKRRSGNDL